MATGPKECPIDFKIPPRKVHFGSLEEKVSDQVGEGPAAGPQVFPNAKAQTSKGVRVGRPRMTVPGWLMELNEGQLNQLMELKNVLSSEVKMCDVVDQAFQIVAQLCPEVTKNEVVEIMRRVPWDAAGSFPRFLLALGSPLLAREHNVFEGLKKEDCQKNAQGDQNNHGHDREKTIKRLTRPKHETEKNTDTWPMTEVEYENMRKRKFKGIQLRPKTTYNEREKIFFSALFVFELFRTIEGVEELYSRGGTVPESKEKILINMFRRGEDADQIGIKKLHSAEWDVPSVKSFRKGNPYIDSIPITIEQLKSSDPEEKERQQTMIHEQQIRNRVQKVMEYLASEGNCIAMLPNSECIIHLSDIFLKKSGGINHPKNSNSKRVNADKDLTALKREMEDIFVPFVLPKKLAEMNFVIEFDCALCLRTICQILKERHWEQIGQRKNEFRDTAWNLMRVDKIPCGRLRRSFVYLYDAYLPWTS